MQFWQSPDGCSTNVGAIHGVWAELGGLLSSHRGMPVVMDIQHCYCHKLHNTLASAMRVSMGEPKVDGRQGFGQECAKAMDNYANKTRMYK